ncbi:hypothetical protein [Nocardia fluminea]|uniref:Uncharacterized protein n=1 Tax=Nocardia fluminea TaxID=134984 RepID=A0A2N3VC69_9NOCA|nr:hypothetical protein [Nocardia fluminea]PKV79166.1 hypothetical protein ATK86_3552 [Nocardia fluminea]
MVDPPHLDDVIGYLQAQGWTPQVPWRNGWVWSHGEFDVLVPDGEVADFTARMRALVRCVADSEQRSAEVVVRDIVSGGVDIVGYRAGEGEVSLDAGTAALAALRSLLVTCAYQVAGSEIRISSMRRRAVAELLDDTTLLPRRDTFGFDVFLAGPGSRLGRGSAIRLLDLAATVRGAAQEERFGIAHEIRYDTVELFSALGSAEHSPMRFELNFRWSHQVPRPDVAVEFSSSAVARLPGLIDHAVASSPLPADRLASLPGPDSPAVIEGVVVGLDNDGGPKAIVRGVLVVDETTTGRRRRVTVRLRTADEYAKALTAHSSLARVRATGTFDGRRDLQVSENGFTVIEGVGS